MIEMVIGNSECSILGLSVPQFKQLREILSYTPDPSSSYYSGRRPSKSYLISTKGVFPTGLLYLVQEYLKNNQLNHVSNDTRIAPKAQGGLFHMRLGLTPYPEQTNAVAACLRASRGIVSLPTGTGKSFLAALIVNALQVPTLVVVPSLELKAQLTKTMVDAFGADKVGKGKPIWVQNVDSLDYNKPLKGYDCVIIDEFHHSGAKTYRKMNKLAWSSVYYKFGLTATPFRSRDNERLLLESVLSEVIYTLDYHTAVSKGYIVPVEAYYIEVPRTKIQGNERSWPSMYSELVVNNEPRNQIIANLLLTLQTNNISTLCLVKEVKHGHNLQQGFFVHGENEDTPLLIQLFNERKFVVLSGTMGVLSEGVDTKPAEYVLITGLGKSKGQFMQAVGRAVRRYPGKESAKVIIFLDKSHGWTRAHFKAQSKILLEEYGVTPLKLELT